MIQKYKFEGENDFIEFDDSKSVKELINYAFDKFDYFEPAGIEIVTLFQCHHPNSSTGWFTTDTSKKCSEEIINREGLCFAYYMPNVFYFAEGGWGHHMNGLGNHPDIPNAVKLIIRFDDFRNTIVINGAYSFNDIINYLKKTQYIEETCNILKVYLVGIRSFYEIGFSDPIMNMNLTEFEKTIQKYIEERFPNHDYIYHEEFEIC